MRQGLELAISRISFIKHGALVVSAQIPVTLGNLR